MVGAGYVGKRHKEHKPKRFPFCQTPGGFDGKPSFADTSHSEERHKANRRRLHEQIAYAGYVGGTPEKPR